MLALAVDFGVPVRMGVEVLLRREIFVERMDKVDDPHRAAVFWGQHPVAFHARGEGGRLGAAVVHLAGDHLRRIGDAKVVGDDQRRLLGDERVFRSPPANADDVLEERIDRVQATPLLVSRENQVPAVRRDQDLVEFPVLLRGLCRMADENQRLPVGGCVAFGNRLESRAGHELQMLGKLARGRLLDDRRFAGQDDSPGGRAVPGQFNAVRLRLHGQETDQWKQDSLHGFSGWLQVARDDGRCLLTAPAAGRTSGRPRRRRGRRRPPPSECR